MSLRTALVFAALIASLSTPALANAYDSTESYTTTRLEDGEPLYCDYDNFKKYEVERPDNGVERAHVYQLGQLTLVGLAVGDSPVAATQELAAQYGTFAPEERDCTWYFNDGSDEAAEAFHQQYVPSPVLQFSSIAKKYRTVLSTSFATDPVSFLSCATKHHYIAMGCDGMRHRGPSVFAMLLAFSGCSAKNATKIANKVWGINFVFPSTRRAIAQVGYDIGEANPAWRQALQQAMLKRKTAK